MSAVSSISPAVLSRWLWQLTQYFSTMGRGGMAEEMEDGC
jgi:hypothetical protein